MNDKAQPGKLHTFTWEWQFDVPPDRLWPYVSDTDLVNRIAGLPPVTYRIVPQESGGSETYAEIRLLGFIPLRYREHPFEWVENHRHRVQRDFDRGPLYSYSSQVELFPEGHGTHLVQTLSVRLRWSLIEPFLNLAMKNAQKSFGRAYARFAEESAHPGALASAARWKNSVEGKASRLLSRIAPPPDPDLQAKLAHHIAAAEGRDLRYMRPFALAREFGHPKEETLSLCLSAVQAGALNLAWNLLCPHCRDSKKQFSSLGEVSPGAYCDACNIDYEVEFDRSLEATFSPTPALRRIREEIYCVGGPGNTPHVVEQFTLQAGEERGVNHNLSAGSYRIRCERSKTYVSIRLTEDDDSSGRMPVAIEILPEGLVPFLVQGASGAFPVTYANRSSEETLIVFERTEWVDDAATALDVAFFPEFHRIFGSDALRPGEGIAIENIAVLFTDLKGSTQMYEDIGDAVAYGVVRGHFDILLEEIRAADGHLVKTIGDAVMASFRTPDDALRAALGAQKKFAARGKKGGPPIVLKAGIHSGHAIAVGTNGRNDFFGTTINIAARTQGQSLGGDIVITDTVRNDPAVVAFLAGVAHKAETFEGDLKGIEGGVRLHRIWPELGD
ncbi:MAG: DUF5939 domain-containing protein [bacterium]